MSELKPCPFCGWEFAEHAWNEFGEEYRVCDQCGALSGTVDSKWDWQSRPIEDELRKRIAELEAAQRWIPVDEKPLEAGAYFVRLKNGVTKTDWTFIDGGIYYWWNSGQDSVTHYMPLPQPPEVQQ